LGRDLLHGEVESKMLYKGRKRRISASKDRRKKRSEPFSKGRCEGCIKSGKGKFTQAKDPRGGGKSCRGGGHFPVSNEKEPS